LDVPAWATQSRTDPLVLEFAALMPPFSMLAIQAQAVVSTTVPSGCHYGWRLKTDSSGDCAVVVPSKQELSGRHKHQCAANCTLGWGMSRDDLRIDGGGSRRVLTSGHPSRPPGSPSLQVSWPSFSANRISLPNHVESRTENCIAGHMLGRPNVSRETGWMLFISVRWPRSPTSGYRTGGCVLFFRRMRPTCPYGPVHGH